MATTHVAIATMKVAQITRPGADFEVVDREIPVPGEGPTRRPAARHNSTSF